MVSAEVRSFYPARLVERDDAGGGLVRMTLATAAHVTQTHASPGQYIEVRTDDQTGFFVLASQPGAASWELVMRAGGGVSDVLLAAAAGKTLEVTSALGEGFPMGATRGHPVVIALGGSGVAAGPGLVRRRVLEGDAIRTRVFVGVRTRDEFGMRRDLEAWAQAGVHVLVCVSNDDLAIDGIECARGYVQDVLLARAATLPLRGGFIFAVGAESMIGALRRIAPEIGLEPRRVLTNH